MFTDDNELDNEGIKNNRNKDNSSKLDDSELNALQKKITDIFNSIENSKKKIFQLNEEGNLLDKKIKKSQELIEIKNASIQRLDVTIKLLENKFGDKYNRKKYTDELKKNKNQEDRRVCEILKEIGIFEKDSNSKSWLKNWQSLKNKKILNTEKLKFMKYLGTCSKSIEDLFNIDDTYFNNMQLLNDRIFIQKESVMENTEDKISGNIHIKVLFKEEISYEEIEKLQIETENDGSFHVFKIAIIDYDFFYNVNGSKLRIIEIKILACTFFGVEINEFMIVDENFKIWPYDVILFDEILQINLEKKFVKKNCKFFHLNPIISQNIKLILIPRSYYEKICVTFDDLKFVEKSIITRNSLIAKFMKTKIVDRKNDLSIVNDANKFKLPTVSKIYWTKEVFKEKILAIFKEMYFMDTEREKEKNKKYKKTEAKNNLQSLEDQSFLNRTNLNSKPDNRNMSLSIDTSLKIEYNFKLNEKIKKKIKNNHSDLIEEFGMDVENLLEYFDLIVQQRLKMREFEIEEEMKFEEFKKKNPYFSDDPLDQACLRLIYNKENRLIPRKRLVKDKDELKTKDQIKRLIDDYLKREKEEKEKIKSNNSQNVEEEKLENFGSNAEILNKQNIDAEKNNDKKDSKKIKKELMKFIPVNAEIGSIIRVVEFLCILIFFICNHIFINQIPISEENFLNKRMVELFDTKLQCIQAFSEIKSPGPMNNWLYNCLLPTMEINMKNYPDDNISIKLVDFQIENNFLVECSNWKDFNITWKGLYTQPTCIGTKWESLCKKKEDLLGSNEIKCNEPKPNLRIWGLMDYMFLENPQIINGNTIELKIDNEQNVLKNFRSMLELGRNIRCSIFQQDCLNNIDDEIDGNDQFKQFTLDVVKDWYYINQTHNNVELVDAGTKKMNINVYFLTEKLIGMTKFIYEMAKASVSTKVITRSFKNDSPESGNSEDLYYLEYIQILCAGLLSLQLYMKYLKIRSIKETLNNSFFFVMFLFFFVFEYVFKIMNDFKGTVDYVFFSQLIGDPSKRELIPYFIENVKIIKSFSIVFLSYHLIYVVFDIKYLIVFTSFLKPVFQRFLIVLCLIILSLSLLIMAISGRFYDEFSSFSLTFFNLLNYVLGVDSPTITDDSTFPVITTQTRFYFQVASYALRILVVNFTLIIMFHLYRKNDIKRVREQKK